MRRQKLSEPEAFRNVQQQGRRTGTSLGESAAVILRTEELLFKDVKVIVDRRSGERRATQQPVKVDQRRADRRRASEELVEVLIAEGSAGSSPLHQGA